jgi:hypothetical protein
MVVLYQHLERDYYIYSKILIKDKNNLLVTLVLVAVLSGIKLIKFLFVYHKVHLNEFTKMYYD